MTTCVKAGRAKHYQKDGQIIDPTKLSATELKEIPCTAPSYLIRDKDGKPHRYACVETQETAGTTKTYYKDGLSVPITRVPKEQRQGIQCGLQTPGEESLVIRTSSKPVLRRPKSPLKQQPIEPPRAPSPPKPKQPGAKQASRKSPSPKSRRAIIAEAAKPLPKPTTKQRKAQKAVPLPKKPPTKKPAELVKQVERRKSPPRAAKTAAIAKQQAQQAQQAQQPRRRRIVVNPEEFKLPPRFRKLLQQQS